MIVNQIYSQSLLQNQDSGFELLFVLRSDEAVLWAVSSLTCSAMLSFITMLLIWSRSWVSEVMVVVAVATFSTLRLHSSRSSSQSANPALPGLCRTKLGGGWVFCTPNNSLRERQNWVSKSCTLDSRAKRKNRTLRDRPQLCQEDAHYFGHVDVDIDRKFHLGSVQLIHIVHLKTDIKENTLTD